MMKWPMWIRVLVGIGAALFFLVLSILAQSVLGEYSLFLLVPGAGIFIYLNPELMRGD